MWIKFSSTLINTDHITSIANLNHNGDWRILFFAFNEVIAQESFGESEAMAKARFTIIENHLKG